MQNITDIVLECQDGEAVEVGTPGRWIREDHYMQVVDYLLYARRKLRHSGIKYPIIEEVVDNLLRASSILNEETLHADV